MNPFPVIYWILAGALFGLLPRFVFGWSWWASLGAGMIAAPPLLWLFAALLDRFEASSTPAPYVVAPPAPLVLESAPPCPKCGAEESAQVLYGLIAMTDEVKKAITEKKIVLGGCPVYAGASRWICSRCRHPHGHMEMGTPSLATRSRL